MVKISHRAIIRYLGITGWSPKEIYEDMVVTLEVDVPSYSTVKKWTADCKRGKDSLEDDTRPGRLVTTQKTIYKMHDTFLADRRITECYISTELGIS